MNFTIFTNNNLTKIPKWQSLPVMLKDELFVTTSFYHFKTNNYVINELIHWDNVPDDPCFRMTFPLKEMLEKSDYKKLKDAVLNEVSESHLVSLKECIRNKMIKTPVRQIKQFIPQYLTDAKKGMFHQFPHTILLVPRNALDCYSYCTYCYRWSVMGQAGPYGYDSPGDPVEYLRSNTQITDVLFTGGDPFSMNALELTSYVNAVKSVSSINSFRFGTRMITWWPYRFVTDNDADQLIELFEQLINSGKHVTLMAHISHPNELSTNIAQKAIERIRSTGAEIRCQCPVIRNINDNKNVWIELIQREIQLGLIPYYMFIETGDSYNPSFKIPLSSVLNISENSMRELTGLSKTLRGPVQAIGPFKILIDGVTEVEGKKYFVLKVLQAFDPNLNGKIYFAQFDEHAYDIGQLKAPDGKEIIFN
jgi:KamA family protein